MAEEIVTILRFDTGQSVQTLRDLRENIKAYKKELEGLDIGTEEYRQTLVRLQTNKAAERFAMQGTTASLKDIEAAALGVGKSYNSLSTQLSVLQREQHNINIATDEGKAKYAEMAAQINAVNDELKALDAQNGNFRRNVGNYQSAFNGLNMATAQIMRELPSLGMNVNTFFLAISNNIPMLVDQIQMLREQNRQLLADSKPGINVFRQFLKSFISLNSLISIGVTLLTLYGAKLVEWIGSLFKGRKAAQDLAGAVDDINKSLETGEVGSQIAEFEKLARGYRAVGDSAEAKRKYIEQYREEIDKTGLSINSINAADNAFITNSDTFVESLKLRAQAMSGMEFASKQYAKAVEQQIKDEDRLAKAQANQQAALRRYQNLLRQYADVADNPLYGRQIESARIAYVDATADIERIKARTQEYVDAGNAYIDAAAQLDNQATSLLSGAGLVTPGLTSLEDTIKRLQDIKLEFDAEVTLDLPDAEDIQAQLDEWNKNTHASNRGYERMQLEEISSTAAADIRRTNLSILQDSETTAEKVYEIEMTSMQRRLELLREFKEQASRENDQEAALEYAQEIADLEVEIELRGMEEKKRLYDQDLKNKEDAEKKKMKIAQQAAAAVSGILDSIADVYEASSEGNEKAAQQAKNLRIASTIIETISGAVSAYMNTIKTFKNPAKAIPLAVLNAATVLAAGYAQIEKIRNTEVSKDSAPSGSASTSAFASAPAMPSQPEQVRTLTSASEEERLNRMADDQRVYVLASDIEAAQRSRRVRVRESTF